MKFYFRLFKLPLFIMIITFIFIFGLTNFFKNYENKYFSNFDDFNLIESFINKEFLLYSNYEKINQIIKFKITDNKEWPNHKKLKIKIFKNESFNYDNYKLIKIDDIKYEKKNDKISFKSNNCIAKNYNLNKYSSLKICDLNFLIQFNSKFKLLFLIIKSNKCKIDINKSYNNNNINDNMKNLEINFYLIFAIILFIFETKFLIKIHKSITTNNLWGKKLSITTFSLFSCLNLNLFLYNILISFDNINLSIIFLILSVSYIIQFFFIVLDIISNIFKLNINDIEERENFNTNVNILLTYLKLNIIIIIGFVISQNYFYTNYINYFWGFILLPQIIKLSVNNTKICNNIENINNYYVCKMIFIFYLKFFKYNFIKNLNNNTDWMSLFIFISIIILNLLFINFQITFGVNFFIPKKFKKIEFNYFDKNEIKKILNNNNCIICMNSLKEINLEKWENILEDKILIDYLNKKKENLMITPCKHLYHSFCLVSWMNFKMRCPCCRESIPNII